MNAGRRRVVAARLERAAEAWARGDVDDAERWCASAWQLADDDRFDHDLWVHVAIEWVAHELANDNIVDAETWMARAAARVTRPRRVWLDDGGVER